MKKTQLIILRGTENCGKTTLCAEVYKQLLPYANKEHFFGKPWENMTTVKQNSIILDKKGDICDFQAILFVENKKIGFFSMGDYVPNYFKINIQALIDINIDILICCTRSRNKENSTFRYIDETYSGYCKQIFWVNYAPKKDDMYTEKQKQAKKIAQFVLNYLGK